MAYSDYITLRKLQHDLAIIHKRQHLFFNINPISPSIKLIDDLAESQNYYSLLTEKAKSEFLITPVLREIRRTNLDKVGVFSGINLDTSAAGLSGFCDFILTRSPDKVELSAPIFCLVEAKNRTLEEGFAQCAAEMHAAILFNQENQMPVEFMHGCVTNGYEWSFLKLENQILQIDTERFFLNQISMILGIFQIIIDTYDKIADTL